jgi:hypothetical protein
MKPFPDDTYEYRWCFPYANYYLSPNSIKAMCNVASRVTVTSAGIIKMVPLSQDTFNYTRPGSYPDNFVMNCKDLNASGLFNCASLPAALPAHAGSDANSSRAMCR